MQGRIYLSFLPCYRMNKKQTTCFGNMCSEERDVLICTDCYYGRTDKVNLQRFLGAQYHNKSKDGSPNEKLCFCLFRGCCCLCIEQTHPRVINSTSFINAASVALGPKFLYPSVISSSAVIIHTSSALCLPRCG